ncbi:hypothetical protein [Acinetobacter sp.]|uniref:hypothetical protein n=1 Tax=Acinetobacter sp. TaxID=472 RepID=UPI0035B4D16D
MNSKSIEEYDFDNPNRITISASFGITSNRAKTVSTTVDVPIKKTQTLSKTVAIPIKKARSVISVNTIISNLERLASSFGINIKENQNVVELEDIDLGDIEKLLEFANDPIFSTEGANLKEAYFKFQNSDGTYTHKSFIVETVRVSDEVKVEPNLSPTTSTDNLQKLLRVMLVLLALFNNSELGKTAKDISTGLFASILYDYGVKPYIENLKPDTQKQSDISNIESLRKFLTNKRVTKHRTDLFESPQLKSSIIENLPPGTMLTFVPDKTIPKSWLKVKITLDQSDVEGYVLRRYTAQIR